jgi:hypothetical protein
MTSVCVDIIVAGCQECIVATLINKKKTIGFIWLIHKININPVKAGYKILIDSDFLK